MNGSEQSLTEIELAALVSAVSATKELGLFLGNSMPIRDVDMYCNIDIIEPSSDNSYQSRWFCLGTPIVANRGASG